MTRWNLSPLQCSKKRSWRISADLSAVVLLCAFYIGDMLDVYCMALLCALFHELGHLAGIWLCGGSWQEIRLHPFGVEITMDNRRLLGYPQEMFIYAMGPAVNLLLAWISWRMLDSWYSQKLLIFCGINLSLFAINLIPAGALDGGRVLRAVLLQCCPFEVAEMICRGLELLSCGAVIAMGIGVLWVTGYNISLLAVGVFLLWQLTQDGSGQKWLACE